jgi:thiol:disulfide interchange protein DsbD
MDLHRISAGSLPKPPARDASTAATRRLVRFAAVILAAGLSAASGNAAAQARPRFLEPERAFAYSVQAVDDTTVEARFAIAPGYYLYREKMKFSVDPASLAALPELPPGKVKDDQFFGKVETYRGEVAVRLALKSPDTGAKVTVRAESQGCADAGICYPPQVQNITVTLPLPGAGPGAPVAATPARKSWFN